MTAPVAEPPSKPTEQQLSARGLIAAAYRMVREHPRESMLPLAVVQLPVTLISASITAALFFTVFKHEEVDATRGGPLLALLLTSAFEGLFAQVARAGTIVSIASVAAGVPKSLSQSLDPAFTRMGELILIVAILAAGFTIGIVSLVGIVLVPYLLLRVAIVFEVMMLEDLRPVPALKRTWQLTSGNLMRLLALLLLTFVAIVVPLVLVQSLAFVESSNRTADVLLNAVFAVAQGVLLVPIVAFLTATTTLFYLDLRRRPVAQRHA